MIKFRSGPSLARMEGRIQGSIASDQEYEYLGRVWNANFEESDFLGFAKNSKCAFNNYGDKEDFDSDETFRSITNHKTSLLLSPNRPY